jgi:hypothetical protein
MKTTIVAASALLLMASVPAFAGSLNYPGFNTNDTSLTFVGDVSATGGPLAITPDAVTNAAGAAYTTNALALGSSPNFTSSFQFSIANGSTLPTANGFAFVLTSDPTGLGAAHGSLGLTGATSLAVEFSDYGNKNQNPLVSQSEATSVYNSNLVAAISNGNTVVAGNPTGSYGSPGPQSCVGKQTSGNGCMNNGDVWTADISYVAGKLTVALEDGAGQFITVISGYAIALGSNVYAGFTGSTGTFTDSVSILNWSMTYDVPEPMTVGMFGVGIAALGFMRSRRRSV